MMKFEYAVFRFKGAPVYVHLSVLLCFLYFWARDGWAFGSIETICFLFIMLIHEMGHAWFVRYYHHRLIDIRLYPIHGACHFEYDPRFQLEPLIYAGGLLAQALLFITWWLVSNLAQEFVGYRVEYYLRPVSRIFLDVNFIIAVINLLPIRGLDGYPIWSFLYGWAKSKFVLVLRRFPERVRPKRYLPSEKIVDLAIKRAQRK